VVAERDRVGARLEQLARRLRRHPDAPGGGLVVVAAADGTSVAVINVLGTVFMDAVASPFGIIDGLVERARRDASVVIVDVHAEATSEKVAMGWHLDGRVTACVGTHTHVPTADARVLPGGTAYISDVGMTGPRGGVIGVKRELALERFLTQMPIKFETSDEDPWINAVVIEAGENGLATSIEQILLEAPA
jgi:metallophosphoesterase (TIGR00282 family)